MTTVLSRVSVCGEAGLDIGKLQVDLSLLIERQRGDSRQNIIAPPRFHHVPTQTQHSHDRDRKTDLTLVLLRSPLSLSLPSSAPSNGSTQLVARVRSLVARRQPLCGRRGQSGQHKRARTKNKTERQEGLTRGLIAQNGRGRGPGGPGGGARGALQGGRDAGRRGRAQRGGRRGPVHAAKGPAAAARVSRDSSAWFLVLFGALGPPSLFPRALSVVA